MKVKPAMLLSGVLFVLQMNAHAGTALINWTGNAGYRAQMTMTYDDAFGAVLARGDLSFSGPPTNQGITELKIDFYTPSSLQPIFSVNDISNNLVMYRFLTIGFDTTGHYLFGNLDVGKDTFGEGLPGGSPHEYYLTDYLSPILYKASIGQVDSGGVFVVTIVPEPSTWTFCFAALVFTVAFNQRTRRAAVEGSVHGLRKGLGSVSPARPVQYIRVQ